MYIYIYIYIYIEREREIAAWRMLATLGLTVDQRTRRSLRTYYNNNNNNSSHKDKYEILMICSIISKRSIPISIMTSIIVCAML